MEGGKNTGHVHSGQGKGHAIACLPGYFFPLLAVVASQASAWRASTPPGSAVTACPACSKPQRKERRAQWLQLNPHCQCSMYPSSPPPVPDLSRTAFVFAAPYCFKNNSIDDDQTCIFNPRYSSDQANASVNVARMQQGKSLMTRLRASQHGDFDHQEKVWWT